MSDQLARMQREFAEGLLDVTAVSAAMHLFQGEAESNRERFAHYRGNALATWHKTCAAAFPVLQSLVGEEFFEELSRQFALAHPSQSGDLNEFGSAMPEFIAGLEQCQSYPFLSDVAGLEWLVHRSYHAALLPPETLADMVARPPELLMETRYILQPAAAVLESPWAIADIWLAHQSPEIELPEQISRASICLIWREPKMWKIQVCEIDPANAAALQTLKDGNTLGEALDSALAIDPEFAVQAALSEWLQRQLLVLHHVNQESL